MTVAKFLEVNKPSKYVITDRVRTPLTEEVLKFLDLTLVNVYRTEEKNNATYIYTDFSPDSC